MAIEEKYDQVRQLITMGKERGYLLYDEVNDILPAEVHSSDEIDDLLSTFERHGIDVFEDAPSKASGGYFQMVAGFGVVAWLHLLQVQGRQGFVDIIP